MILAALLSSLSTASVAGSELWGKAVMAEPFEDQPFRPIIPPDWVWDTLGAGYTLSGQDTEARAHAARLGVAISELNVVDPFYPYYDSRLLKRRSPHVPLDRLPADIAEYKRLGIRILAVYPPSLQGEAYELHPDWRRVSTNTREVPSVDLQAHPYGGMLCLLGPYGDFFIEVLAEILTLHPDVDAFSFDGLHYGGVCYCQHCREAFRTGTGAEIPDVNMEDAAFRRYQHWADRRMEDLVRRLQARLKAIKPSVALVTWTTNAGRFGHLRDIPRNMPARMNLLLDAPDQEFWMDESNRGATIVPAFANAYLWAVTNHRVGFSEPYLMSHGNPYGKDSFPAHEVERRMLLALTHGAFPSIAYAQPPRLRAAVNHSLKEVQRRRTWITRKSPEPWAAMVMSDNTRVFYGRDPGQVEARYQAGVFGAFRAALETHLPFTLINDWNLNPEDLRPYKVLILPNTAVVNERQTDAIRQYVRSGGGLIASLDVSLCDEFGNPRGDLALGDVLGVSLRGPAESKADPQPELDVNFARHLDASYWAGRSQVWTFARTRGGQLDSPGLRALLDEENVTFKGPAVRVAVSTHTAHVAGTLAPPGSDAADTMPAVVLNQYGKGRVAYLAAGFDSAYYLYAYPYQRVLLQELIEWAAASPPPVTVKAPMCVQAVATRQRRDGERLVIHLFNDVNTTAFHALPNDDVPLREETIPIHDIQVRFEGYSIRRVHLEPDALELAMKPEAGGMVVTVPRLDIHAMVVAELWEGLGSPLNK